MDGRALLVNGAVCSVGRYARPSFRSSMELASCNESILWQGGLKSSVPLMITQEVIMNTSLGIEGRGCRGGKKTCYTKAFSLVSRCPTQPRHPFSRSFLIKGRNCRCTRFKVCSTIAQPSVPSFPSISFRQALSVPSLASAHPDKTSAYPSSKPKKDPIPPLLITSWLHQRS